MEIMDTHNRRSFLKIAVSGIIGFGAALLFHKKENKNSDKQLKEADFYKKHHMSG